MSELKTDHHPDGTQIWFEEEDHRYFTKERESFTSGTTFVHRFFPEFDKQAVARRCSLKTGKPVEEYLAEWEYAGIYGTNMHNYCENLLLTNMAFTDSGPEGEKEAACRPFAWQACERLLKAYKLLKAEKIVFCPDLGISGMIDLLMYDEKRNVVMILDWKTNKKIEQRCFGKYGFGLCQDLPDVNWNKYRLQLSLYKYLLQRGGYFPPDATYECALIHINPNFPLNKSWFPFTSMDQYIIPMVKEFQNIA